MNSFCRLGLCLVVAFTTISVLSQEGTHKDKSQTQTQKQTPVAKVVLTGTASTAHIADPNERVVFNGRVMRMADFVAAVSSSNEAIQRLRTQEMRSREKDLPTPPSPPSD